MSFGTVVNRSQVTLDFFISCKLLPSHTGNSMRSGPGRRSVANRSQNINGQSGVGLKCITVVGSWLWFWSPSLCRQTYKWRARVASSQICRGAVASHSYYLANYTLFIQSLPDIDVSASLRSDDKSLTTAHESKKSRILQLVNRS